MDIGLSYVCRYRPRTNGGHGKVRPLSQDHNKLVLELNTP